MESNGITLPLSFEKLDEMVNKALNEDPWVLSVGFDKPFDTINKEMYMVATPFNSMSGKFKRGDVLFVAYETDEAIGFCTKDRQAVIIIKEGNPTFTTDFIKIGVCPININE